jgi:hypothetical protein
VRKYRDQQPTALYIAVADDNSAPMGKKALRMKRILKMTRILRVKVKRPSSWVDLGWLIEDKSSSCGFFVAYSSTDRAKTLLKA